MTRLLLIFILALPVFGEDDFNSFKNGQNQGFADEKAADAAELKAINAEFDAYKKLEDAEFKAFKKKLGVIWDEPKTSSKKKWVEYSKDLKQRKTVDFENNTITIDVHEADPKKAKKAIAKALINTVTKNTKDAYKDDILAQNIEKKLPQAKRAKIKKEPILGPSIFDKVPSVTDAVKYAMNKIKTNKVKKKKSKVPKLGHYSVTIKMPSNSIQRRSKLYVDKAKTEAALFKIPLEVVMGVIHTESAFNPMAKSHIPAYGLMQIVPRSAGRDVYKFLYKERKLLSPSYLHNADNNIKMGTAYLHMLYYKYLKAIKNPESRLYCAIASYNTGAGNVSRTFSGTTNPYKAAKKINKMTPKEVYNYMIRNLKYKETRDYLKRVSSRAQYYKKQI